MGQLRMLHTLDLHSNHMSMLHPELGYMRNLQIFNIDENPLVSPPKDVLKQVRDPDRPRPR
jgi:Leucine-rich repeat (LRR) protein